MDGDVLEVEVVERDLRVGVKLDDKAGEFDGRPTWLSNFPMADVVVMDSWRELGSVLEIMPPSQIEVRI